VRAPGRFVRPDDDLVLDIVRKLTVRESRIEITNDVRHTISTLRSLCGPLWGNKAQNIDYFRKLRGWVEKLQTTLAAAPTAANTIKLRRQIEKLVTMLDAASGDRIFDLFAPEKSETLDTMFDAANEQCYRFGEGLGVLWRAIDSGTQPCAIHAELEKLRTRCDRLIDAGPGEHGLSGHQQDRAAIAALLLMKRWGKRPGSTDAASPFREITGLLYEAMTGAPGQDMARACRQALRAEIRTE
jgi:hypothetical protein